MLEQKKMDEYTDSELADICDAAADEIMIRGGGTGRHIDPSTGAVCINGAIGCALGYPIQNWRLSVADRKARGDYGILSLGPMRLQAALRGRVGTTWVWNDGLGTGPEPDAERIELLRTVAKDFRNGDSSGSPLAGTA